MARPLPNRNSTSSATNGSHRAWLKPDEHAPTAGDAIGAAADRFDGEADGPHHLDVDALDEHNEAMLRAPEEGMPSNGAVEEELRRLQAENEELRGALKELEALLEEKSETIRHLHQRLQEVEERPPTEIPREEELLALSEELERERKQLKEDEEALMLQMREMEVQMSRERAEFARQRTELQRLQAELRHELELAARDAALRERLAPLMRRHHEMGNNRPTPGGSQLPEQGGSGGQSGKGESKFLRRLFG